jgi:hypothetical protein
MLALNKFKITEDHKKYSIDEFEPLLLFGLSCGMFSSPAVSMPAKVLILVLLKCACASANSS